MRTLRGFTLVELLVTVAILAVLIALIVPAAKKIQHSARSTKCLSQIRNLALANATYMSDHRGRFIDAGLPHGNLADGEAAWINTLRDYYENPLVMRSPLDTSPHWSKADGGEGVAVPGTDDIFRQSSYGVNNYLTQYSPYQALQGWRHAKLSQVPHPAATVHFLIMVYHDSAGFCGADHVHAEQWGNSPQTPPEFAALQMQSNAVSGPVGTGEAASNYGFLDGHVETLRFSEVYIDADHNRFDPESASTFDRLSDSN